LITDAQVHIYEPNTPQRPWPKEEGRVPATLPSYSAEQMIGAMQAVGVDRAVIVPPSWQGDQNDVALAAAAKYPYRFAVMGRLDPFDGNVAARVEHWRETPGLLQRAFMRTPSTKCP
jgi:L-fuconolactonase